MATTMEEAKEQAKDIVSSYKIEMDSVLASMVLGELRKMEFENTKSAYESITGPDSKPKPAKKIKLPSDAHSRIDKLVKERVLIQTEEQENAIAPLLLEMDEKVEEKTKKKLQEERNKKQNQVQRKLSKNRVEQGAVVSAKFEEPKFDNSKFSSVADLPDADSSLATDYPNTYGYIDDKGNFFKVNRKTGDVQFVHFTGTCIKVNETGDVTINTKGSLKQVVEGDMALQVKGSLDIASEGGLYLYTEGEMELKSDGSFKLDTADNTVTAKSEFQDDITEMKNVSVMGKLDVTQNVTTKAQVSAMAGVSSQADVMAGGGSVSLMGHKHISNVPGVPTSPSIP